MKIYEAYNSYETEDFEENKRFSCHSWLFMCIDDIAESLITIAANSSYLNQKDLVGKYNATNYFLDIYLYHQSSRFINYPKERNPELDFSIILYGLLENGADVNSVDYARDSFLKNLNNAFVSQETLSWKQKNKFINSEIINLCKEKNRKEIITALLEKEKRPIYLGLYLELSLLENNKKSRKIKV